MENHSNIIKLQRKCPLCGSLKAYFLHEMQYAGGADIFLPSRYKIVCCKDCRFLFNDFSEDPDVFRKHYEQMLKYANPSLSGGGGFSASEKQAWKLFFSMLKKYIPDQKISIMDLGCGKGGFLNYFKNQGYTDLLGIDPSALCIQRLQQHGINGVVGDIQNILSERQFELILSTSVFEHLPNFREVLRTICDYLKPGAFVCLVVPDADKYKCSTNAPYYYFDQEHINHFNKHTLSLLGRLHSLTPILIRSCNLPLANGTRSHYNLIAIFQKENRTAVPRPIMQYLNDCTSRWGTMSLPALSQYERIFLWGIGAYAANLLASGFFRYIPNLHLVDADSSKQGKMMDGMQISGPEVLLEYNHSNSVVLITSVLYEKEIIMQLERMNWRGGIHSIVGDDA